MLIWNLKNHINIENNIKKFESHKLQEKIDLSQHSKNTELCIPTALTSLIRNYIDNIMDISMYVTIYSYFFKLL